MTSLTKATYSFDSATVDRLKRLAHRWQVSKSETIRRALAKAEETDATSADKRIAALVSNDSVHSN